MWIVIVIAVSLSMDAFSLALAYGTLNLNKKLISQLSIIVGLFHFFMPLLGLAIGSTIFHFLPIKPPIIVFLILLFIGIQMIIETFKPNENQKLMSFKELLLFGFAVSVDSFSVGVGLRTIYSNIYLSVLFFSLFSFIFTYLGLLLGKKINSWIGKFSTLVGGIVLIVIGFIYLFH